MIGETDTPDLGVEEKDTEVGGDLPVTEADQHQSLLEETATEIGTTATEATEINLETGMTGKGQTQETEETNIKKIEGTTYPRETKKRRSKLRPLGIAFLLKGLKTMNRAPKRTPLFKKAL